VATLVIGFGLGGWVTGGTAQEMARQAAQESRLELVAAVRAEDFMRAANARATLAKLEGLEWYERDDLVVGPQPARALKRRLSQAPHSWPCETRSSCLGRRALSSPKGRGAYGEKGEGQERGSAQAARAQTFVAASEAQAQGSHAAAAKPTAQARNCSTIGAALAAGPLLVLARVLELPR
jgi:hypothetical protein